MTGDRGKSKSKLHNVDQQPKAGIISAMLLSTQEWLPFAYSYGI